MRFPHAWPAKSVLSPFFYLLNPFFCKFALVNKLTFIAACDKIFEIPDCSLQIALDVQVKQTKAKMQLIFLRLQIQYKTQKFFNLSDCVQINIFCLC